jgi:phenylalanyl-tRNA synthetase beta chain
VKVALSWLKDHLETAASAAELGERLTMLGLEVERIEDPGKALAGFVVARIVEAHRHPNADKLKVCIVDTGEGHVQVVCGAPNARSGMKAVFAAAGSYIPGTDMTLKRATIRGVESNGMLLSPREMGLSDEHEGILELAEDAPVGRPAVDALGGFDPVLDVAITPNRGDCLGVRGIARELAAAGCGTLKPLPATPVPGLFVSPVGVVREFSEATADACPYFVGRTIRNVRNGESPEWLQRKLIAIGLRPISALVDITNYLTFDVCRPLHVFDADKVRGNLHVRLARPGERLAALNGRTYELDGEMTVIADDEEAEALGGVIGGERTACTETTTTVFLESALFDPLRTAATGRKLAIQSDARYRFERGVDPSFLTDGIELATRLVLDLCGGEPSELVIAGGEPEWRRSLRLRPERIRSLGGIEVAEDEVRTILSALGFRAEADGGALSVSVPPWRSDVVGEACLVEEVIRVCGYPRIAAVPLERETALPREALSAGQRRRAFARRVLAGRGLVEAVTFSFVSADVAAVFAPVADELRLANPISADLDLMRPTILPNLIAACRRNADRGIPSAALFEVGPQYAGKRPEQQRMFATAVRSGTTGPRHWATPPRPVDLYDAKADAFAVLTALGVATEAVTVGDGAPAWYHPGRSGVIRLGRKPLAAFGEVHPGVLRKIDAAGPLVAVEIDLDALPAMKRRPGPTKPPLRLSPLQPVERDFAFLVDEGVPADAVVRAARGADSGLIAEVRVFDVFSGDSVGAGKKSLAITVVLQPTERTLTEADLERISQSIAASVAAATGGRLRA